MGILRVLLATLLLAFIGSCHYKVGTKLPDKQFVFVDQTYEIEICNLLVGECREDEIGFTGSGVLIGHNDARTASYILSAAHVCREATIRAPMFILVDVKKSTLGIKNIDGKHPAKVVALENYNDLCLIETHYLHKIPMKVAKKAPKRHRKFWNLAAPHGIWSKDNSLWFEGYFTGYRKIDRKILDLPPGWQKVECNLKDDDMCLDDEWEVATYTIPAAPGSSGSPVFDGNGRLVGMISMVARPDYHVSFGPTHEQIKSFLDKHIP